MKKLLPVFLLCNLLIYKSLAQNKKSTPEYPFNLEYLKLCSFDLSRNDSIIPIKSHDKFLYINSYSNKKGTENFDEAYPYYGNYALVKKDGLYGIIDRKGQFIIKPRYAKFTLFRDCIKFNDTSFFSYGEIFKKYPQTFSDPIIPNLWPIKNDNRYLLIFPDSNKLKTKYDSLEYDSVFAVASIPPYHGYAIVKKFNKIGVVGGYGKTWLPFIYDEYNGGNNFCACSGVHYALRIGDTWYYFRDVTKLFSSRYKANNTAYQVYIFKIKDYYNYFNEKGEIVLSRNYKEIFDSGNGAITDGNKVVLFSKNKNAFTYFK